MFAFTGRNRFISMESLRRHFKNQHHRRCGPAVALPFPWLSSQFLTLPRQVTRSWQVRQTPFAQTRTQPGQLQRRLLLLPHALRIASARTATDTPHRPHRRRPPPATVLASATAISFFPAKNLTHGTFHKMFRDLGPVLVIPIRMFLGLPDPDPDPFVRGTDPALDPSLFS
jgi:hypothetical protein